MRLLIILLFVLTGCGENVAKGDLDPVPYAQKNKIYFSDGYRSAEIQEIEMPSGTRCVVLLGFHKSGIDCDWKR